MEKLLEILRPDNLERLKKHSNINKELTRILEHDGNLWNWSEILEYNFVEWDVIKRNLKHITKAIPSARKRSKLLSASVLMPHHLYKDNKYFAWNYEGLSSNPSLPLGFIRDHIKEKWSWPDLTLNTRFTWETFQANSDLPWDEVSISRNCNITWDIIEANPSFNWDFSRMWYGDKLLLVDPQADVFMSFEYWDTRNLIIPGEYYRDYARQNWRMIWDIIKGLNPYDFAGCRSGKVTEGMWKMRNFSFNSNLTIQIVVDNPGYPWNWTMLSIHPGISAADIQKYHEYPWDVISIVVYTSKWGMETLNKQSLDVRGMLVYNRDIVFEIIMAHTEYRWDWDAVCTRFGRQITMELVKKHPRLFEIGSLAKYCNIDPEYVLERDRSQYILTCLEQNIHIRIGFYLACRREYEWNWNILSRKVNDLKIVRENPDLPWNWEEIGMRTPWEIIILNLDLPWEIDRISYCCRSKWTRRTCWLYPDSYKDTVAYYIWVLEQSALGLSVGACPSEIYCEIITHLIQ